MTALALTGAVVAAFYAWLAAACWSEHRRQIRIDREDERTKRFISKLLEPVEV